MRFAYFYFMRSDPERVREVAPRHAQYWRGRGLPHYLGGPFGDRSGGLITFDCESFLEAGQLIANDPFRAAHLLERHWLKEWKPD
jgi:hypothetical protein